MRRRDFLLACGGTALVSSGVQAQDTADPVTRRTLGETVVVELANFHCNRCRAVNDHFPRLRRAAEAVGLDLRFAPVAWQGQSLWPDRVYYAIRDLFPQAEGAIRDALFDGIQREGMAFEDLPQTLAYLERRQVAQRALALAPQFNLAQVADRAATDDVLLSEMKAGRLADLSGATEVPVFLWLTDGETKRVLSPRDAKEPAALVAAVQQALAPKN